MTDLIKRNIPILAIVLASLAVLVGIVIISQKQPGPTGLERVDESELIADHTFVRGPDNAQATLVEFADFQCPYCATVHPLIESLLTKYPQTLKFAYRHFPLPQHPFARKAAIAAQAAGKQEKFWEYHNMLYENQDQINDTNITAFAKTIGLDMKKFETDTQSGELADQVSKDAAVGTRLGVNSTPTFFLNGRRINLNSLNDLSRVVDEAITKVAKEPVSEATDSAQLTQQRPNLEITFTENGFVPAQTNAYLGQKIVFINETGGKITIAQKIPLFDELSGGISIEAGARFEFKLTKDKLWTFMEENSGFEGTLFINPVGEE